MHDVLISRSPADPGDVVGRFPVASEADVDSAVARARAASRAWRDAGLAARSAVL
ncbi:MAG: aldehyde dehydrogenase, partial [Proteobacteria bacterium]